MKTQLSLIAIAALAVSALAGAQTPPSSSSAAPPSSTAPSTTTTTTTDSSSYSNSGTDSSAAMKDCLAKQKASNPQISAADAKAACKAEPK